MIWWTLIGMSIITFVNRYVFFADAVRYSPGIKVRRFLSYSSYAVLTSIWAPIVFSFNTQSGVSHAGLDYLVGATIAAILSVFRVPSIAVVVISTASFFCMRFVFIA